MVEYPHPQLRTPARSVSLLAIAWALSALPAAAQGTAPSPEAAAPADTVADITVTARRHEETLQNVPLSITALSALDLENAGVKDLRDVADAGIDGVRPGRRLLHGADDPRPVTAQHQ